MDTLKTAAIGAFQILELQIKAVQPVLPHVAISAVSITVFKRPLLIHA